VLNLGTNSGLGLAPTIGDQREAGIKYQSPAQDLSVHFAWFDIGQERRIAQELVPGGVRQTGTVTGFNGTPEIPSVTLYDAMIGYRWNRWDFSVDGKNLGDKTYISWCRGLGSDCGYGELRTWNANVRYSF
jgi:outer membrane receptor protein involved in Fe transport